MDSLGNNYPIIPLSVEYSRKKQEILALIDSGATISIFRKEVADYLQINIKKGKEITLGGVGGKIKGYLHDLKIEVAGKRFICPVVFSQEYSVSFNLLGRESFFKNFTITFLESKRQVKLD